MSASTPYATLNTMLRRNLLTYGATPSSPTCSSTSIMLLLLLDVTSSAT